MRFSCLTAAGVRRAAISAEEESKAPASSGSRGVLLLFHSVSSRSIATAGKKSTAQRMLETEAAIEQVPSHAPTLTRVLNWLLVAPGADRRTLLLTAEAACDARCLSVETFSYVVR